MNDFACLILNMFYQFLIFIYWHLGQFVGCGFDIILMSLFVSCRVRQWRCLLVETRQRRRTWEPLFLAFPFSLGCRGGGVGHICLGLSYCCINGATLFKTWNMLRGDHLNLFVYHEKYENMYLLSPWTWVVYQIPIHVLSKNTWMGHAFLSQMPATRETLRHFLCMNISLEPSDCFFFVS